MGRILGMVVFTVGLCVVLLSWLFLRIAATTLAQIPSSRGPAVFAEALLAADVTAASAVLLRARNPKTRSVWTTSAAVWICVVINFTIDVLFPAVL